MARTGDGPKNHDDCESPPGAQNVHQTPAAHIHQSVSQQEGRIQDSLYLIGDGNFLSDFTYGNRERLAIKITDRYRGAYKDGNPPAKHASNGICEGINRSCDALNSALPEGNWSNRNFQRKVHAWSASKSSARTLRKSAHLPPAESPLMFFCLQILSLQASMSPTAATWNLCGRDYPLGASPRLTW